MAGLGELLRGFVGLLGPDTPAWVAPALVLALLALAWPSIRRADRTQRARTLFRTAPRLLASERGAQEDAAFELVRDNADGLISLADMAIADGRPRLAHRAVHRLAELRSRPNELRRLVRTLEGPMPGSAMEACLLVETLRSQGQLEEAARRLRQARVRWPRDAELAALDGATVDGEAPPP